MELKDIQEALKQSSKEVKDAVEAVAAEQKELGKVSAETKSALELAEKKQAEISEAFDAMDKKLIELETEHKRFRDQGEKSEVKTLGQAFVGSDIFTEMKSNARGSDKPFNVERKDITSLAASAGALIRPDRDPTVYRDPNRPMRIRDLIPAIPTTSGSVEVMRLNAFTNNAAPQGTVAEQGGGEFVAKAKSEITWDLTSYIVKTIAHWVAASRQALSDAPMLAGLIDTELTYGLDLESDDQLLQGDGTGQNVTGLLVDADVPTVGEIASGTSPADLPAAMIEHIRAAVTQCQTNEYYNMTGIVLNPTDWATLETAKATDGHYLMIQFPANGAEQRIWRMPVVVTNAMPVGSFILGDWTMGAKLYVNEGVSVRVSESHADYFVKNGVAVLAEERYAFAVTRPNAFCKGSFAVAA